MTFCQPEMGQQMHPMTLLIATTFLPPLSMTLMPSEHQEAEKASFFLAFIPTFFKRKGGYIDEWQRRGWRASDQCSGATG